jgi:hypothetical protein
MNRLAELVIWTIVTEEEMVEPARGLYQRFLASVPVRRSPDEWLISGDSREQVIADKRVLL